MKKFFFVILALILVACSPQVTVTPEATATATIPPPTETPIPTPTPNPYFVALQNQISELSENLTLLPDGTIEELTADGGRQTIPNLHVDQNGVINILFNNEQVVIEISQIAFDAESGLTIEGYELNENGEWEVLTPTDVATDILGQYGVDIESVTITETEGIVSVVDNASGEVLFETNSENETSYGLSFAVDTIAAASCEPTDFAPFEHNGLMKSDPAPNFLTRTSAYFTKLFRESGLEGWTGMPAHKVLLHRNDKCWGGFTITSKGDKNQNKVLYYRDAEEVVHVLPIRDGISWRQVEEFALNR